jgi:hypothetical protein
MAGGVGLGVGPTRGAGVGVGLAWKVVAIVIIASIKPAQSSVVVFVILIGVLSWRVMSRLLVEEGCLERMPVIAQSLQASFLSPNAPLIRE